MNKSQSQSKTGKKQKNLYLSTQARQLLALLARNTGISETAVIELLIREKAARDNLTLPREEGDGPPRSLPDRRRGAPFGRQREREGEAPDAQRDS